MAHAILVAATAATAAGSILGAGSESKALRGEAAQLDYNAGQRRASSQRQAIDERRDADLAGSRALALAAASGGGADDPTVVNLVSGIHGEGEFRALTALYDGNTDAAQMEREADARRKEAKIAKRTGYLKAAGSILSSGSTLYDRFGGK